MAPKDLSGALDHRVALQWAHSIGRAEHELLDARHPHFDKARLYSPHLVLSHAPIHVTHEPPPARRKGEHGAPLEPAVA